MGSTLTSMASTPKAETLADGTVVYRVKIRLGHGRAARTLTETFNPAKNPARDLAAAKFFALAFEANGNQWPHGYAPGIGFLTPEQMVAARAAAAPKAPAAPGITLREYAEKWLASRTGIEAGTRDKYGRMLRRHIYPVFGDAEMADVEAISPMAVGKWVNELGEGADEDVEAGIEGRDPQSAKSIHNIHGLLSSIMKSAVESESPLRTRNPCAATKLPKPGEDDGDDDDEMVFLTPEEWELIDVELAGGDVNALKLSRLMVGTGLRFSEATALQIRSLEDISGRKPALWVNWAWKQGANGSYRLGKPKTKTSVRRVRLNEEQADMLGPLLDGKRDKDLIFNGPNGGRLNHDTFFTGRWVPACYQAMRCFECRQADYEQGIGRRGITTVARAHCVWCGHEGQLERYPRPHDLRHTQVAWLIASGAPLLAISRRLGHASIKITQDRYGHLLPEVEDDLVANLSALMRRPRLARAA